MSIQNDEFRSRRRGIMSGGDILDNESFLYMSIMLYVRLDQYIRYYVCIYKCLCVKLTLLYITAIDITMKP